MRKSGWRRVEDGRSGNAAGSFVLTSVRAIFAVPVAFDWERVDTLYPVDMYVLTGAYYMPGAKLNASFSPQPPKACKRTPVAEVQLQTALHLSCSGDTFIV